MARLIPIIIRLDGSQAQAEIAAIGRGLDSLNTRAVRQISRNIPSGFNLRDTENARNALNSLNNVNFTRLKSQLHSVGDSLKSTGEKAKQAGQTLTVGLTLPIVGLGAAAIKSFADVELAVANISSIKPEINTSEVFSALNEMSTRIPQTAQELGDGLYNIFSSINVSQTEALKLLEQFGKGATAAQTDAQTFGTAVLGVMNAYKLSVSDAAHISDVFFNTVNLGVVNGAELASTLGVVTAAAKNAGVGFDELGALIVGVTKEGGQASQNINNLSNFLQKLPTKQSSAALKQLGVDVQIEGKFRPVIEVLGDLKSKLDEMPEAARALELQKIFPDAQARIGAQVLLSQLDAVKEALELNKNTAGAADAAYQKIAGTASVQLSLLKNTTVAILAELGSAILPVLQPVIIWLTQNLIPAVKQAVESFKSWSPIIQTVVVAVAAFAAAIGPVLVVVGTVIAFVGSLITAIGTIVGVISAAAAAVGGLGPLILIVGAALAQIGVVVGIVVAHIAVLYAAWQLNFGGIRDFTLAVWDGIKSFINAAMTEISEVIGSTLNEIRAWWQEDGASIMQAVNTVYSFLANVVKVHLDNIRRFWEVNGESIKAIVKATWEIIKTIFQTGASVIMDAISLIAAVINGDWAAAWNAAKNIAQTVNNALIAILKQLWVIVKNVFLMIYNTVVEIGAKLFNRAVEIGRNLVQGLMDGMNSLKDSIISTAKTIILAPINAIKYVAGIQSPSKVTMQLGRWIAEGLAVGMETSITRVKNAAKRLTDEIIKDLRAAIEEFQKLAGATPEQIRGIQTADRLKAATSAQSEIIKLRAELGRNQSLPLPSTLGETERELAYLKQAKQAADDFNKSLDDLNKSYEDLQDAAEKSRQAFEDKLEAMRQSGNLELLKIREEIELAGVTDEHERHRIQNYYEILRLREQMQNDGFGSQQIDEAARVLKVEQARKAELLRILEIRKQVAEASELEQDLTGRLEQLRNGNRELTEYEKTLQKINTVLKDISPQQKENLLILAQQIDAQKAYNEAYNKTYDFIRNTFEILTDSGRSFKDKLKDIFGGILNSFKKMLLDMATAWLTSKLLKLFGLGSGGQSGGQGGGIGGILGSIFGGNAGGGIFNFGGSSGGGSFGGSSALSAGTHGGIDISAGGSGGKLTGAGAAGLIGVGANILGGLIGGKAGSVISSVGSGIATGAAIGSIIPGIGTVIGAAIGGIVGFFSSIFGSKKRKIDKQENLPQLQKGFADAMEQLRALGTDKNAFLNDPEGVLAKALELRAQIASGFGINFQSKKYRAVAQQQIQAKLAEADRIIEGIRAESDRAITAKSIDDRLNANFAGGTYMSPEFLRQYSDFKKRNGVLPGAFTGQDTLPSMLARGEMVLNPEQIARVKAVSGFDPFRFAGIPNYAQGTFVPPTPVPGVSTPVSAQSINFQPNITIVVEGEGISDAQIKSVVVDGLQNDGDVQVKLVESYDRAKKRMR